MYIQNVYIPGHDAVDDLVREDGVDASVRQSLAPGLKLQHVLHRHRLLHVVNLEETDRQGGRENTHTNTHTQPQKTERGRVRTFMPWYTPLFVDSIDATKQTDSAGWLVRRCTICVESIHLRTLLLRLYK